jgi:hypothetical protein
MRDSKNILHAKLGVSPMERQYGGGLDDAYMNRRRSSAFAAPNATSAFASPMSQGGLPTIYREQGGPLPITSVYGQGIPRIVYRENGGDFGFYGDYTQEDIDEAMAPDLPEAAFGAGQYNPKINISPRPTGITTEKNQETIQAEIARQNAIKAAREADRGIPPEAAFGAAKKEDERDEVVDFWRDPNNILAIQARNNRIMEDVNRGRPSEEEYENYYSKLAREAMDKQNREASKAGNLFPGFNVLTGNPLTPTEQLRAALPFIPSQRDIKEERDFQENKKWVAEVNKYMKKEDEKKAYKNFDKHLNRQADRITNSNLPPADKIAARNSLKDTINNYGIKDEETVTKVVDSIVKGSEINRKTGGGLPTIYRQDSGQTDFSEETDWYGDAEEVANQAAGPTGEDDWTAAKAQAQLGAMRGPSKTMQELEEDKELGYSPVELANIYQSQGDKENASRVINESILSNTARNALLSSLYGKVGGKGGWDGVENFIANMSPEDLANFNAAASGSSWLGDIKGDDPSKGWRFGGPEGTLEDIFEKSVIGAEEGLQKLLKDQKKKEEKKEEKSVDKGSTLGSLLNYIEKGISKLTGGKSLTPETIESMQSFAKSQGDEFIPTSVSDSTIGKALSFMLPGPLGMLPKPIGVYRTKNGLEFDVAADRSLSLRTPTPNIDYGNDVSTTSDKPEKKKEEVKKEEEKKSYMKDYFSGLQSLDNTGDLKNFYEKKSLEYIYPNKTSAEINAMINKP